MSSIDKHSLIGLGPNNKKLKEYKESLYALNHKQKEAAIGLILGDASLNTTNNGKTYRIKFEWSDRQKPYVDHVFNLFDQWVLSKPHKKVRISPKGNKIITWGFQTISHKAFNDLATLFITKKKKTISNCLIKNYLTPVGLAYWFCDDGGKLDYNKNSKNKSIVLNTQSFTNIEVKNMSKELMEKFNLDCEVRSNKGKKVIIIKGSSYTLFRKITDPYIISEMKYKLP
jgi:LAGLIDADG DNA endonuclease family